MNYENILHELIGKEVIFFFIEANATVEESKAFYTISFSVSSWWFGGFCIEIRLAK